MDRRSSEPGSGGQARTDRFEMSQISVVSQQPQHARLSALENPDARSREFHSRLPGYRVTPLRSHRTLARSLGVQSVLVKDESMRMGMPSFKILGVSWALYRHLEELGQFDLKDWRTFDQLRSIVRDLGQFKLVAASDGNHGHAVARMARMFGFCSEIFVPSWISDARRRLLREEGATVVEVDGTYDSAVAASVESLTERTLLLTDTWEGKLEVGRWVLEGFATMGLEIKDQLQDGLEVPDIVVVQMGAGGLAASLIRNWAAPGDLDAVRFIGVEPQEASCVAESLIAGTRTEATGNVESVMPGLNCDTPSPAAWPYLKDGLEGVVVIPGQLVYPAMRLLATEGIRTSETGASGIAGLLALSGEPLAAQRLGLAQGANVLAIVSEGITDPETHNMAMTV
jgi:diaminopropionate ammonia-lyase